VKRWRWRTLVPRGRFAFSGTTLATSSAMSTKRMLTISLVLVAFATACHDKRPAEGPAERAGRKVDEGASKTKEKTKEAAEDTKEAAGDAKDEVKDDAKDAKKKAKKKTD
jgi:hypothetical protein